VVTYVNETYFQSTQSERDEKTDSTYKKCFKAITTKTDVRSHLKYMIKSTINERRLQNFRSLLHHTYVIKLLKR